MENCKTLTQALKHYFAPVGNTEMIGFVKSCSDDDKRDFRAWFVANGYPNVAASKS